MLNSPLIWMVTAAALAGVGYVAYRKFLIRAAPRQHAELTRELSADLASLRSGIDSLLGELTALKDSPAAGSSVEWFSELEADVQEARRWHAELPPENMSYAELSAVELDMMIIDVVAATVRVAAVRLKYEDELSSDPGRSKDSGMRYLEPAA